ncbi:hypothetical protein JW826_06065 [Candidatus Woesearchaeota archaeon]|nr:hypothetical protein [Candidatus Woesearchaeota archaeon]
MDLRVSKDAGAIDAIVAYDVASAEEGIEASVLGGLKALERDPKLGLVFVGDSNRLDKTAGYLIRKNPSLEAVLQRADFRHAASVVGMAEHPARALVKTNSSLAVCVNLVHDSEADIWTSPGNSKAVVAYSRLDRGYFDKNTVSLEKECFKMRTKALKPGLLARVPCRGGGIKYVCDTGGVVDPSSDILVNYAFMTSKYLELVIGLEYPRIALLNIGSEPGKGGLIYREAYDELARLGDSGVLNFVGNREPKDIFKLGIADGFVSDAQVGNTFLKASEATVDFMVDMMRKAVCEQHLLRRLVAAYSLRPVKRAIKSNTDTTRFGGAFLLGTRYNTVLTHGAAGVDELTGSILYSARIVRSGVSQDLFDVSSGHLRS